MKRYLFIPILLFSVNAWSAPSTTLSITPSAVDAAVIEASDVNTRHSAVTTWANAHDHVDITRVGNTLSLGDGTTGNKTIEANNSDGTKPFFRFNDTDNRWVVSGDGTNIETIVVMTGGTQGGYVLKTSTFSDDLFVTRVFDDDGDTQIQVEQSSDEDIIRMSTANVERWNMSAAGERTMTTQPSFLVRPSISQDNVTTAVTVVFGSEIFDQGGDFSSNTFTAPVTGRYFLGFSIELTNIDSAATNYELQLTMSNRNIAYAFDPRQFAGDITGVWNISLSGVWDMDANDTATIRYTQSSGSAQTDINTGSSFSGFLAN